MEIVLIAVVAVVLGAAVYLYNRNNNSFDLNKDGKVDKADAEAAVTQLKEAAKKAADVNKDGKVDKADAKAAATKAKASVKKSTAKAKTAVKKATGGRKPKAK